MSEYADLFKQTGTQKRLLVSFPNLSITLEDADIKEESMEISESLCSGTELRFGSCEASVFKLRIIGNVIPLIGETCVVSMYVGDIAEPYSLGTYKVASDKPTADRRYRDIVAYDAMHDILTADVADWYNTILPTADSTTTLGAFRTSFVGHFGLEHDNEPVSLPNDEMVVTKTIDAATISGRDVLTAICELNGCFGHIGRNGKMQYIFLPEIISGLYPSEELYPAEDLFPADAMGTEKISAGYYTSCKYEDYTTKHIGKLQIRQEENDIGCIVGEGENCYIVEDNFLVYGKSAAELEAIAQRLFDIISIVWYRPATTKAIGNPCLEVGAGIRMITRYEVIETYILERTLKGIQGLIDSYDAKGEETYSEDVNSVQRDIKQLKGKTNTLTRTVEETKSRIEDVNKGLSSEISQTAEEIRAEVANADSGLYSEISQTADAIRLEISDLSQGVYSKISQLSDEISLCVTSGEVQSMIDITLDGITITAEHIDLNGYVSAGGGNFTIDDNGNLKIINDYHTIEVGDTGMEVSGSTSLGSWKTIYGSSAVWFYYGGSYKARIELNESGLLNINTSGNGLRVDGSKVALVSDLDSKVEALNKTISNLGSTVNNMNQTLSDRIATLEAKVV